MSDGPTTALERAIERNRAEQSADIARLETQLTANHADVVHRLDQYLLTQVYNADERARQAIVAALADRIQRLEKAIEEEQKRREKDAELEREHRKAEDAANRRMYKTAIVTAVLSVITMVVGSVIITTLVTGGAR